nr:two-component regulator propeller domain-containing protein [uncultured Draconibacterium sp.]
MKSIRTIRTILIFFLLFGIKMVCANKNDLRFQQISPPGGFTLDRIQSINQDNLGYIWLGTSQGLIRYDSHNAKWFQPIPGDSLSLSSRRVQDIFCDDLNQIWVSTNDGLCLFDRSTQQFRRIKYTYEDGSKPHNLIRATLKISDEKLLIIDHLYLGCLNLRTNQFSRIDTNQIQLPTTIYRDNSNRIWIGTSTGDIFLYNPIENSVKKLISNNVEVRCIYTDNNQIWIGTEGQGAKLFDLEGNLIKQLSFVDAVNNSNKGHVRVIKRDTYGRLWFGTYQGLFMDDGRKLTRFKPEDYPGLPHNSIYEIFEDQQGGLWFGTWSGGVALIHHSDNNFETFRHSSSPNSISSNTATALTLISNNNMLVGTELGGLNKLNINIGEFNNIQLSENESIQNIKSLCKDTKGGIWVGTFRKGLWYKSAVSNKFKVFDFGPDDGKHISQSSVYSLCAVDSGVWIGTFPAGGVNFYSFKTKSIRRCFLDRNDGVDWAHITPYDLLADTKSNLWIGTVYGAIYKIHIPTGQITKRETSDLAALDISNTIHYFWENSSGEVWIGTNKGILIYNPESTSFKTFNPDGVLTGKSIYSVIQDANKQIWIATNNGLFLYNPEQNTARNFLYSDGIQSNLFYPKSVAQDVMGNIYFGGPNGITKINPNNIKLNDRKPFTIINEITTKDNRTIYPVYSKNHEIEEVIFRPGENTLRFSFSADNYLMPEKNRYKYRLVNYYDDWIDIGNEGSVLLTSVKPGEYIFEVKACNNDGIWNETPTQLKFEIKKYWYNSNLAYVVYFLFLATLTYFIARFYLSQLKLKRAVMLEKQQRENEEQMHEMKLKFFTNISHEFRTPLTLISWPLKRLMNAENITKEQREELDVVNRNSNRLLQLINQLIDIRKLEKEKSKLNISRTNIIDFTKELQKGFSVEAKSREISFLFESPHSVVEIEADLEKLDTILYNLLSNAYKYVADKGQVKVSIAKNKINASTTYSNQLSFGEILVDEFIEISIEDNGAGIDNEDLLKIFTRFEQGKQTERKDLNRAKGSGLGLAMCKDFTLLHHGKITVQSERGKGSRFTVHLPVKQKAQKVLFDSHQEIKNLNLEQNSKTQIKNKVKPEEWNQILIVEDNPDFRKFISKYLNQYYQIQSASDGKEALQMLKKHNIDVIVSDVMMPEMDGFELCSIVKTQIETSHIPVILLTALSSSENLIAGLDKGADAYLTKPFDEEVLVKQIENIIAQRRRIQENFSKQFIGKDTIEVGSLDNFFLNKVRDVIEKNLTEESFSMEALAEELMISRSKLHRKIKSLSGITTSEFVNLVRIKKAVELITTENYRFNEVAYLVGFSSQSYFNRCFKKVYNVTPKEYFSEPKE